MIRVLAARTVAELLGDFDREPAYRGLAEGLRVLVSDGRLPTGVRLPSERALTEALGVSRTTVTRAYAELRDHGYLVSRQGSGSVTTLPRGRGFRSDLLLPAGDLVGEQVDLTVAAPVPTPGVLATYERAVAALPRYLAGTGYYPSGLPVLREAVAEWYAGRGLPTRPEQVLVVPGALAGVAVVTSALLRRGDRVLVESPTYPNATACLRRAGVRLAGVDVGRERYPVDDVVRTTRQVRPAAAYLVPDFHNPTGHLVDDDERGQLARALGAAGTVPVVDESMAALALDGQQLPLPLAAHAPAAVSVGSVSKPFWGGLRVGWVRVPTERWDEVFRARLALDLGVPPLEQLVAADLLGHGQDLLAARRAGLRASRDVAVAALARHLPDWRVRTPSGGLSLWCELPAPASSALVRRALDHDVLLAPGPSFAPEGGLDRFLRIPFTAPPDVLERAVARLADAWTETVGQDAAPDRPDPTLVA